MSNDPQSRIRRLFDDSTHHRGAACPINISGNGNIVAIGDVHYYGGPHPLQGATSSPKTVRITEKQRATLTRKLNQWLTARNAARHDKLDASAAWRAVNNQAGVVSQDEMTPAGYRRAINWLRRQTAALSPNRPKIRRLTRNRNGRE